MPLSSRPVVPVQCTASLLNDAGASDFIDTAESSEGTQLLSYPTLPYPTLPFLPYFTLHYTTLPHFTLPNTIQLPYPALSTRG